MGHKSFAFDSDTPEAKMAEKKSKSLRWALALQQSRSRTKLLNQKWYEGMMSNGYEGGGGREI